MFTEREWPYGEKGLQCVGCGATMLAGEPRDHEAEGPRPKKRSRKK